MMGAAADKLSINPAETARQAAVFLSRKMKELGRAGIILGLSGGLDSAIAACLAVRAVGPENVTLLNLPDRDSKAEHIRDAHTIAGELGIELHTIDLSPILKQMGVYALLPIGALPGQAMRSVLVRLGKSLAGPDDLLERRLHPEPGSWVARGNAYTLAKHRLRMVVLYQQADLHGLMVVGAANRTEYLTGTFSHWGIDHCADVMPIRHLYRSQLPALAAYLGVPAAIRSKKADPDLLPGIDDKEALLGSFEDVDQILWGLEQRVGQAELARRYGKALVDRIAALMELSGPMRETPYAILPAEEKQADP
jgi:NAD+ synthase